MPVLWSPIEAFNLRQKTRLALKVSFNHTRHMKQATKLQKRKAIKVNLELQALNAMRTNTDLHDAIEAWIYQPHLCELQRDRLRAILAVLSHAPLKKVVAFL